MPHEVGIVCRCVLCDSYFVTVIDQLQLGEYRGKAGKAQLEDRMEAMQALYGCDPAAGGRPWRDGRLAGPECGYEFLPCPTCIEAAYGMRFQEWFSLSAAELQARPQAAEPEPEPQSAAAFDQESDAERVLMGKAPAEAVLALSVFVEFDPGEGPPLYVDQNAGVGKPKWTLVRTTGDLPSSPFNFVSISVDSCGLIAASWLFSGTGRRPGRARGR